MTTPEIKYGITTMHRVYVVVPDITHDYLVMNQPEERRFEKEIDAAWYLAGHSGSDVYAKHEEWAEFTDKMNAEAALSRAYSIVDEFTQLALKEYP